MLKRAFFISILLFAETAFGQTIFNRVTGWEAGIPALTPGQCAMATTTEELGMVACPGAAALQNLFETMNAPLGSDPVADSPTDTLNFAQSTCLTITGDSGTDTLTWAVDFTCTPTWTGQHHWTAGGILLDDSVKLVLGTGSDAEIYFDGTNMVQKAPAGAAIKQDTTKLIWPGLGMTIEDVLGRGIIVADATDLTIDHVNLEIEEMIKIHPTAITVGVATVNFIEHTGGVTLDQLLSVVNFLKDSATYTITTTLGLPPKMMWYNATLENTTNPATTHDVPVFWAQPVYKANAVAFSPDAEALYWTAHFMDNPTYVTTGGGSYGAATKGVGFRSQPAFQSGTVPLYTSIEINDSVHTGGTLTDRYGIRIRNMVNAGSVRGLSNASTAVEPPINQSITAGGGGAGTVLTVTSAYKTLTSDAAYTLTSTPTIGTGFDGQIIEFANVDTTATDCITLQDQGTLAGSNLRLGAAGRQLCPRDSIVLRYDATIGDWCEVSFSNVI